MMKIGHQWLLILTLLCSQVHVMAQSIEEKKANLKVSHTDLDQATDQLLFQINQESQTIHSQIQALYEDVFRLYQEEAPPEEYRHLLEKINGNKRYLRHLESKWKEAASRSNQTENYGLWHAPETTLEQLIIDYGSQDYVYLIPPDVGTIKLSIASNLPIPRSSWNDMLEQILHQNGVGIREINPYLRQLYLIKNNHAYLKTITNDRCDLETLPIDGRICFVLSPEPSAVRRTYSFLEKFINPQTTVLQCLGRDLLLIGQVSEIQDLLRLCDFISMNRGDKEYRLIPVHKVKAEEMARMLATMFDQGPGGEEGLAGESNKPPFMAKSGMEINGLKVIVLNSLSQALFVVGTREEIKKAEEIICNVENQIGGVRDKKVFWYTVKHSEPEELADVLYRIYLLMIHTGAGQEAPPINLNAPNDVVVVQPTPVSNKVPELPTPPPNPATAGYNAETGGFIVSPAPAQPGVFVQTNPNKNRDNFIVDLKTGSIVMVVEADLLPKLKDLLRKLDVPKKMVQIEILLFEKILSRESNLGLNLLKVGFGGRHQLAGAAFNNVVPCSHGSWSGSSYSSCNSSSGYSSYSDSSSWSGSGGSWCGDILAASPLNFGVFEFFFSHRKSDCGIPGFDLAYRFLLSQDDVQINSSPSILTINQTPATIAINEDISINTGAYPVEAGNGYAVQNAFTRAQYGTTISIKPTIHLHDEESCEDEDSYDYLTIESDITFDTIHPGASPERPNVTRRHIKNQALVLDGDTVILGNLRRKVSSNSRDAIPFIGELPGIGKLFSETKTKNDTTEMFIFITPRIVRDPREELACVKRDLLCRRPGDVPYFLQCVEEAHQYEKSRLMSHSLDLLLGHQPTRYYMSEGYNE